jgi:hypothetical protein
MKKRRNQKPPRKMKPVFLVFCEGDTEETYINFLRKQYRELASARAKHLPEGGNPSSSVYLLLEAIEDTVQP